MKVGIVCEGVGDLAVIKNILRGVYEETGVDYDVAPIKPKYDATEISRQRSEGVYRGMPAQERSNWVQVLDECRNKEEINKFLRTQIGNKLPTIIVHIDTDVCEQVGYDVKRPNKGKNLKTYSETLRNNVIVKINECVGEHECRSYLVYAIAVEKTEAWLIPIYNSTLRKDTSSYSDAKRELNNIHGKKNLGSLYVDEKMHLLSKDLSKKETLNSCTTHNKSLRLFVEDLKTRLTA